MKTLSELLKEISSLPKGNLYAKRIGGKEYWYHQYFDSGKRYTSIVRPNELEGLREKIALRKALEKEYKERTKVKAAVLSSKAREKTGGM